MIIPNERVFMAAYHCYYYYTTLWRSYFGKVELNLEKLVGFWQVEMEKRVCCQRRPKPREGAERRDARRVLHTWSTTFSWRGENGRKVSWKPGDAVVRMSGASEV